MEIRNQAELTALYEKPQDLHLIANHCSFRHILRWAIPD